MPDRIALPLVVVLLTSAVSFWAAVYYGVAHLSALAAAAALVALVRASLLMNRPLWQADLSPSSGPMGAALFNAEIIALAWAWGGETMLLVYQYAGLRWQHGWQYAAGMALIGIAIYGYAKAVERWRHKLASPRALDRMAWITAAQGIVAAAGLAWLVASHKLGAPKTDWAANIIFVAGGIALVVLSACAVRTHVRLARKG